jgi:hypothetical protein
MVKIVLVNKNASLVEKSVKSIKVNELYKKCNLKSGANFTKRHTWKVNNNFYSVYAKDTGRSNSENKYDLPPPVDEALYFNTMILLKHSNSSPTDETIVNLTKEEWEKTYETLFGGFEDLNHSEEPSEDEEEFSDSEKTKEGYHKDGFVVDDDDDDDEDYVPMENDEDDEDLEESASYDEDDSEEYTEGSEEYTEGSEEYEEGSEEEEDSEEEEEEEDSEEEYYSELSEDSYCSSDDE